MFGWLRRLFSTPLDELVLDPAFGCIKPLRIRAYAPNDFAACRELYDLNEPERPREGAPADFEAIFQSEDNTYLVLETDGIICGCGAIEITELCGQASLLFGVIHPKYRDQGIDTALLLARIAMLPDEEWTVTLSPVPASREFYERFNFREFTNFRLPTGKIIPRHSVRITPDARRLCIKQLTNAGVTLDASLAWPPITDQA